jgi:negative regulator of flagellin synthesis FlgM
MAIQSLNGKPNNVVLPTKPNQSEKVENTATQATQTPKDTVAITDVAKQITQTSEASATVNKERVVAIKNAIKDGSYTINAEKIAEKMIQMEQNPSINNE